VSHVRLRGSREEVAEPVVTRAMRLPTTCTVGRTGLTQR
jgi:hypothetical protein